MSRKCVVVIEGEDAAPEAMRPSVALIAPIWSQGASRSR
jgi:hypothetical protein